MDFFRGAVVYLIAKVEELRFHLSFSLLLIALWVICSPLFRAGSGGQVRAQGFYSEQDSTRRDSIVLISFNESKRLERTHRTTPFVLDFRAQSGALPDSLIAGSYDRLLKSKRDSTARIKNFTYELKDEPQVPILAPQFHPLFLKPPAVVQWSTKIDSVGSNVSVHETVGGADVRAPLSISFPEYIKWSLEENARKLKADRARYYDVGEGKKDDFAALMSSVTKIEIPIPANPVFSIFGKPQISLNISGDVNIKAAYVTTKMDQSTISTLGNTQSEPDFGQTVRLNVTGLIGDKLAINANWDTQSTFDYENRLSMVYTGYDDEIVKKVEAGNVSMTTPSTFVGSSQALFGIKTLTQVGPFSLTALISQKKGQTQELSVAGGSQAKQVTLHAYDYSQCHFFIDTLYRSQYEKYYNQAPGHSPVADYPVKQIEVWVSRIDPIANPTKDRDCVATIDLKSTTTKRYLDSLRSLQQQLGTSEHSVFRRLDASAYTFNSSAGILSLNVNVPDGQAIAVAYITNSSIKYGEFSVDNQDTSKALVLKLIKPTTLIPQYKTAWSLQLRNRYPLGGRGVKQDKFQLDIYYQNPPQAAATQIAQQTLVTVFGLDKTTSAGVTPADGTFDFVPGLTIDQDRGEIIFPTLEPFRTAIPTWWKSNSISDPPADSLTFPDVYDTTVTAAQQSLRDKFTIQAQYSSDVSSRYQLGFNLVQNSVHVLLDGVELKEGVDYTVDYNLGEVVIRRDDALVPGKDIKIRYEQNDMFSMASKTLTGLRGDLRIDANTNLGITYMNYNQQTVSDKVRINEEPMSNTMLEFDAATKSDLPFLTKALNYLPGFFSKEMSQITFKGEAAYMMPDPNTKKSTIPIDGGQGVAFIDDFEGLEKTIPLVTGYASWHYASQPVSPFTQDSTLDLMDTTSIDPDHSLPDELVMRYKSKLIWYNQIPSPVTINDIWGYDASGNPRKQAPPDQQQVTTLALKYNPLKRGEYNWCPDTILIDPRKNWGGMMKALSGASTNFVDDNISYLEFWMQIDSADAEDMKNSKMMIDVGRISEDVIPNKKLDTEDGCRGNKVPNGTVLDDEDVGLDGWTDDEERQHFPKLAALGGDDYNDPSGDDWKPISAGYDYIDGTEGNLNNLDNGKFPDTEDLNHNGTLDLYNSYFEYQIPLDTTNNLRAQGNPNTNKYIIGGGWTNKRWYQYRVPLVLPDRKVGDPSLETVQFVRVWFTGASKPVFVRIADMNFVGSQWVEVPKNDSTVRLSAVSIEETPGYLSPPGVVREVDRTQATGTYQQNEQSMDIILHRLQKGDSRRVAKFFSYKPIDVFNYHSMKMFVHADQKIIFKDTTHHSADLFFRFGLDSANYYEYRAPLLPAKGTSADLLWQNYVEVIFSELTALKQGRDSATQILTPVRTRTGPPGSTYNVVGSPSLMQIKEISIGITNTDSSGAALDSTEIWVDELRVVGADTTPGWAKQFETQLKLADLGNITFMMSQIDPFFHRMDQSFGSRNTDLNWTFSATLALDKFLPSTWIGSSLGVSYSHTEAMSKPRYLPGTNIQIDEAAQRAGDNVIKDSGTVNRSKTVHDSTIIASQTLHVADSWSMPTLKLNIPSKSWYIKDIINRFSFSFNYTKETDRSPIIIQQLQWDWHGQMTYSLPFSAENFYSPFISVLDKVYLLDNYKNWKIYYSPQNFNFGIGFDRNRTTTEKRLIDGSPDSLNWVRNFTANRTMTFNWKFSEGGLLNPVLDYSVNTQSDLVQLETDSLGNQRSFSEIMHDLFQKNRLVNFGIITGYDQRVSLTVKPRMPVLLTLDKTLDMNGTYSSTYDWTYSPRDGVLGQSARFNTSLNLTTTLKLKQFTDQFFPSESDKQTPNDSSKAKSRISFEKLVHYLLRVPFLEFDNVQVTFQQSNGSQNGGLVGSNGFANFWGRLPFIDVSDPSNGPSSLYQLGLVSDPMASRLKGSSRFPFVSVITEPIIRASGSEGMLTDTYQQQNRFAFTTSRDLWKGARLDLKWYVNWSYSNAITMSSDSATGRTTVTSITPSGDQERSFFTMPLPLFKSGLNQVGSIYNQMMSNSSDSNTLQAFSKAFVKGFESMPFLSKIFGPLMPRLNYSFRWDGLEQLPLLKDIATRVSLDHSYTSTYTTHWHNDPTTSAIVNDNSRIVYGFQPLANISMTFKELWKGNFGGTIRYSTQTTYDLNTSTSPPNISEGISNELAFSLTYSRRGFDLPLFGLSLKNDLDFSLSYSSNKTSRRSFRPDQLGTDGDIIDGLTRTTIQPELKYVLSNKVTASVYYKKTATKPDQGSTTPGQTVNEFGFNVQLVIGQ